MNLTKQVMVTFPDKLGMRVEDVADELGMKTAELCRVATIEYLRSLGLLYKGGRK